MMSALTAWMLEMLQVVLHYAEYTLKYTEFLVRVVEDTTGIRNFQIYTMFNKSKYVIGFFQKYAFEEIFRYF